MKLRLPALLLIACGAFAVQRGIHPNPPPPAPTPESAGVPDVVDRVNPAVVSIFTSRTAGGAPSRVDPFALFGGPSRTEQGLGSGVIVRADGIIVTNSHVVDDATELRVVLADRRELRAKVVGRDPQTDVAVLRVPADGLPTAPLGDSTRVRVGQPILALGNSMGVGQTVSSGIISATGRTNIGIVEDEDFIQFDAPINPGNSGGPLVNLSGEVIGINTAIATRSGGFQGIGFAVPSRMVGEILEILLRDGRVSRGQLGVVVQDLTPALARALRCGSERGVVITEAPEKGAAREAGLLRGDLIVSLDEKAVESTSDFRHRTAMRGGGAKVRLEVWRERKRLDFTVRLKELDSAPAPEEEPDDAAEEEPTSGLDGISVTAVPSSLLRKAGLHGEDGGLMVTGVQPAASLAGLRKGDLIVEVNRTPVRTPAELKEAAKRSEDPVLLRVRRADGSLYVGFPK
jgi:serine protease Do